MAAQDQSLLTRNYQVKVIQNGSDPRCRIPNQYEEIIGHRISGCPTLALNEYLNRRNRVARYLHWKICKHYGAPHAQNWYENQPDAVTETDNVTILWDYSIQTDRKINANKPDTTIKDEREKNCRLIDLKIPADKNVSVAEFKKLPQYRPWNRNIADIKIEVEKLWYMKTVTIHVVIEASDMIK